MNKVLLDCQEMKLALSKMADQIIGENQDLSRFALVGVRTRGHPLASRISALITEKTGVHVPVGILDITLYRDDLSKLGENPVVKQTQIPFSIDNLNVYLVDDVLYTGRTTRSAMDALFDFGRPSKIRLAVFVERQGRELPIQADIVGYHYESQDDDNVHVMLVECDEEDKVVVVKRTT